MEQKRYLQLHRSHKKRYCVCVPLDSVPRFFLCDHGGMREDKAAAKEKGEYRRLGFC